MQYKFNRHLQDILPDRPLKILVAVSGGADSMCLLDLLNNSSLELEISIAHMNFNLRGEESDADEAMVREYAKTGEIELFVKSVDTVQYAKENSISIEMAARDLRYAWFYSLRNEKGFDYIALAHHANDNAETLLLNIVRGSGLRGICGMKELDNDRSLLRPLLSYTRKEIERYVAKRNIPFRTDHTNYDVEFHRNRIRNIVVPELEKINPQAVSVINRDMEHFSEASEILQELAAVKKRELVCMAEDGVLPSLDVVKNFNAKRYIAMKSASSMLCAISLEKLQGESHPKYWLYEILSEYSFNPSQIEDIAQAVTSGHTKRIISDGYMAVLERGYIKVYSLDKVPVCGTETLVEKPATTAEYIVDGNIIRFSVADVSDASDASDTLNNSAPEKCGEEGISLTFSADKLVFPLVLRSVQSGDSWRPFGMKGKKKVSDYLTDIKMDSVLKKGILVLCNGTKKENPDNIICLPGLEISEYYKVTEKSGKVLKITLL